MLLTILHCVVFAVQATWLGNTSQKALHQEVKTDADFEETPSFKEAPVTVRSHGSHSPSHMSPFHGMGMKTSMMNEKVPLEGDGLTHETSRSLSNKGLGYYSGFTRPHMTTFRPAGKELPPSSHREKRSHRLSLSRGNGLKTTMSKMAEEKTRVADEVSGIVSRTSLGYSSGITRSDMATVTLKNKISSSLIVTRDVNSSQKKGDKTGTPVSGSTSSVKRDSSVTLADPTSTIPYRSIKNPHHSCSNVTLNITSSTNPYNNTVENNFQSDSSPSTTALPSSESPSSLTERHCDETMFDFARQYDLCTRFRSTLPLESCRNRCGREPSFEESSQFCSCDVKCLVYEDCCVDFIDECPSVAKQSREMFKDKASTKLLCVGKYKSISSCPSISSYPGLDANAFSPPEESTILPTTLLTTQASTTSNTYRALEFLENNFRIVIDLSTNLSYNRLEDYECNRSNTSVPFLVPYMIALYGTYMEGQSINSYVFPDDFFDVIKGTFSTDPYKYILAPGIRGCYIGDILHCQNCLYDGESSVTLIKMCETLNHFSNIQRRNLQTIFFKRNAYNHVLEKSTTCSLLSNLKQENQADKRNFNVLDRILEDNLPQKMVLIKPESDIFSEAKIFEFIGAPWKTIRCESRNMVLDECDILQCSLGYLPTKDNKCSKASYLALESDTPQTLDDLQENLTQRIPVCTCMNVYWALVELSQWDLGNVQFSKDLECQFIVREFLMDLRSYKASKLFDTVRHQGTLKSPRDEFSSRYLPEDINADYKLLHKEIVIAYFDALYSCQDDYVKARACFRSSQTVEIDANAANGRDCFQIDEMAYKFYTNVGDESLGVQNMAIQSIPADVVSQMASYLLAFICALLAM